jgi:hypothetical protein
MEFLTQNSTQPANPPQEPIPDPVPRTGKTHQNDAVNAILRALPKAKKVERNHQIRSRNEDRAIGCAYRQGDPTRSIPGERYSSDESLITVSNEEMPPEPPSTSQQARDLIYAMSPKSAASWIKKFLPKHARSITDSDEDLNIIERAKRHNASRREELKTQPGSNRVPGFSNLLYALYISDVYMPLTLFTTENLKVLNREGNTLTLKKMNVAGAQSKQAKVLDTDEFEKKFGYEKDLSQPLWHEATGNFMRFLSNYGDEKWYNRWFEHFNYFDTRADKISNYEAIKLVDIRFRKDYLGEPFDFNMQYYNEEIEKTISELKDARIANLENTVNKLSNSTRDSQTLKYSRFKPFASQTPAGPSRPFQNRTGGDPSAAVCIICAKKGHVFSSCPSSTFEDGKALFCKVEGGNLTSSKGKSAICRSWNLKGPNSTACNNHDQDKRNHVCSFCGEKSHHAFSWTCRRDPSKPSAQN